tara:strand:- start:649 stop:6324 length:5676 start_codon:yes stop_codon:yes gene_type:complete
MSEEITFKVRSVSHKGNYSEFKTVRINKDGQTFTLVGPRIHDGMPKGAYADVTADVCSPDSAVDENVADQEAQAAGEAYPNITSRARGLINFKYLLDSIAQLSSGGGSNWQIEGQNITPPTTLDEFDYTFEDYPVRVASIVNPSNFKTIDTPQIVDLNGVTAGDQRELYILFKHDTATLHLVEWDKFAMPPVGFWRFMGDGTRAMGDSSNWTAIGDVSVTTEGVITGTGFTSSLQVQDILTIPTGTINDELLGRGARVIEIVSDTEARLDRSFAADIGATPAYRGTYRPDYSNDCILAQVFRNAGTDTKPFIHNFIINRAFVGAVSNLPPKGQAEVGVNDGIDITDPGGGITFQNAGHLAGGKTSWDVGIGWWFGYQDGAYKAAIGDPTGDLLTYDGQGQELVQIKTSDLEVRANPVKGPAQFILDPAGHGDTTGEVIIRGDMEIEGTTLQTPAVFTIDPFGHGNETGKIIIDGSLEITNSPLLGPAEFVIDPATHGDSTGLVKIKGSVNIEGSHLYGPANFVIDPSTHGDNTGTVFIHGNLQVDGTTTTVNSTTMTVADINITLAEGATNAAAADGGGITLAGAGATILYNAGTDCWAFNKKICADGGLTISNTDLQITGGNLGQHLIVGNNNTIDFADAVEFLNDLGDVNLGTPANEEVLKYNGTNWVNVKLDYSEVQNTPFIPQTTDDLPEGSNNLYFTDARARGALSVSTGTASSGGALSYNSSTGVFDFSPADVTAGGSNIALTDLSVNVVTTPTAGGDLAYDNTTGVFTFTKAEDTGIALSDLSVTTNSASGGGALSYDNTTGVFDFTPADTSGSGGSSVQLLDDLGDVTGTTYSATSFKILIPQAASGGNNPTYGFADMRSVTDTYIRIRDLSDVSNTSATDGQALIFDGTSNKYVPSTLSSTTLAGLSDTAITNAQDGEFLKYNGTNWINADIEYTDIENPPTLVDNLDDLGDVTVASPSTNAYLKWDGSNWVASIFSGLSLSGLSVTTAGSATAGGGLSYNNSTGEFTYTPALDTGIALSDLSVNTNSASGSGGLSYNDSTGAFTFTPPDLSGSSGIALSDLSVAAEPTASGDGDLAYNSSTGVFTYTPPDLSGFSTFDGAYNSLTGKPTLGAVATSNSYNDLDNKPSIPSSIDDLSDVDTSTTAPSNNQVLIWNGTNWVPSNIPTLTADQLSVTTATASSGNSSLSYNDSTGVFTFTPGDLSLYATSSSLATVATSGNYTDLNGIPTIPVLLRNLQDVSENQIQNGHLLQYVSSGGTAQWQNVALDSLGMEISDLSDVDTSGCQSGDILKFDGTNWVDDTLLLHQLGDVTGHDFTNTAASNGEFYLGTKSNGTYEFYDAATLLSHAELGDLKDVVITNPGGFEFLQWSPSTSRWINSVINITELNDVNFISSPTVGQILQYNAAAEWRNTNLDSLGLLLDDLADITISGVAGNDLLQYNSSTNQWENTTRTGIGMLLDELADVVISGSQGQNWALQYNSTTNQWEDSPLKLDELTDVVGFASTAAPGEFFLGTALIPSGGNPQYEFYGAGTLLAHGNIEDLGNVTVSGISNSDILQYNSSTNQWQNTARSAIGMTLNDLDDATLSGTSAYQLLQYDPTTAQWENVDIASLGILLDNINDVTLHQVADNNLLQYNSTTSQWENETLSTLGLVSNDLADMDTANAADEQLLQYNATSNMWQTKFRSQIGMVHNELADTTISNLADNNLLQYNGTTTQWENVGVSDIGMTHNDLADTVITNLQDNDKLVYDAASSKWINEPQSTVTSYSMTSAPCSHWFVSVTTERNHVIIEGYFHVDQQSASTNQWLWQIDSFPSNLQPKSTQNSMAVGSGIAFNASGVPVSEWTIILDQDEIKAASSGGWATINDVRANSAEFLKFNIAYSL